MSYFGDLVRKLRKERNMTLEFVAKKIGSHKGYVSGIENGKVNPPSVKFIRKFAKIFNSDEHEMTLLAYVDKAPKLVRPTAERLLQNGSGHASVPLLNTVDTGYSAELGPDRKPRALTETKLSIPKGRCSPEFAATVCDASMEQAGGPNFTKGDIVLLAPESRVAHGAVVYVVFNLRGKRRALLRQVMLEQNENVVLQPFNKDFPLEFLTQDDLDAVYRVVGRIEMYEPEAARATA